MKPGKLSEVTFKRSVLKSIKCKKSETMLSPNVGEDCAVYEVEADNYVVSSNATGVYYMKNMAAYITYQALNNIATSAATPIAIEIILNMPHTAREIRIKEIMEEINSVCEIEDIQIIGGDTQVSQAVVIPIITINAIGKVSKKSSIYKKDIQVGDDIIMTKWAGLIGTSLLASYGQEELNKRFPARFVTSASKLDRYVSILTEARIASEYSISSMHDVSRRGIYEALWELVREKKCGFNIDLRTIPIKQETVEICEYYNLNPYILFGTGSLLITAKDGEEIIARLQEEGINAIIIGKIIEGNDKIIMHEEKIGYLEGSRLDEIDKIFYKDI